MGTSWRRAAGCATLLLWIVDISRVIVMLKGSKPAIIRKIQPISVHGQLSLDLYYADPDDPEGPVAVARVGPEAVPRDLEPGDRVELHFVLGVVTQVTKG